MFVITIPYMYFLRCWFCHSRFRVYYHPLAGPFPLSSGLSVLVGWGEGREGSVCTVTCVVTEKSVKSSYRSIYRLLYLDHYLSRAGSETEKLAEKPAAQRRSESDHETVMESYHRQTNTQVRREEQSEEVEFFYITSEGMSDSIYNN